MIDDPIIEEIYQARQRIMEECQGDLKRLIDRLKATEIQHPYRLVRIEDLRKKYTPEKVAS